MAVRRDLGAPRTLPTALDPAIDALAFKPLTSDRKMTWQEAFFATYTDGVVILHPGRCLAGHPSQPGGVASVALSAGRFSRPIRVTALSGVSPPSASRATRSVDKPR